MWGGLAIILIDRWKVAGKSFGNFGVFDLINSVNLRPNRGKFFFS